MYKKIESRKYLKENVKKNLIYKKHTWNLSLVDI